MCKAIDKAAGAEREVIGPDPNWRVRAHTESVYDDGTSRPENLTVPATPDAERWQGWGTALKPAHEPIVVARKPLSGTIAQTVLQHGVGALNIDATRIGTDWATDPTRRGWQGRKAPDRGMFSDGENVRAEHSQPHASGRWPANVVLVHADECREVGTRKVRTGNSTQGVEHGTGHGTTFLSTKTSGPHYADAGGTETLTAWDCVPGCPVAALDAQAGPLTSGSDCFIRESSADRSGNRSAVFGAENRREGEQMTTYGNTGSASRFFYCAKSSSAERSAGLPAGQRSPHPTHKPLDLMRYLVRLVGGQPGSTILDCFAGSGSTGCAAVLEGFDFVGIERQGPEWVGEHPGDDDYVAIARARIEFWAGFPVGTSVERVLARENARRLGVEEAQELRRVARDAGQLDLLAGLEEPNG